MRACYALKPLNWRENKPGYAVYFHLAVGNRAYGVRWLNEEEWGIEYYNGNKWVNIAVGSSEFEAKKIAIKHFYDNHVYPYFDDVSENNV